MSALAQQIEDTKARRQRFAFAAKQYQASKPKPSIAIVKVALPQPLPAATPVSAPPLDFSHPSRRTYETRLRAMSNAPIAHRIAHAAAAEFNVPIATVIASYDRTREVMPVAARHVAVGLMLELTDMSLPAIGRKLGGRDHTTIINSRKRIRGWLKDESFRNRYDQIKELLRS